MRRVMRLRARSATPSSLMACFTVVFVSHSPLKRLRLSFPLAKHTCEATGKLETISAVDGIRKVVGDKLCYLSRAKPKIGVPCHLLGQEIQSSPAGTDPFILAFPALKTAGYNHPSRVAALRQGQDHFLFIADVAYVALTDRCGRLEVRTILKPVLARRSGTWY